MATDKLAAEMLDDLGRQYQAFPHCPQDGIQGDCYRTAIACALGVPRDTVPHSHDEMTGDENFAFTDKWLRPQGLSRIWMPVLGDDFKEVANSLYPRGGGLPLILTGRGPRDVNHVIVIHGIDDFWCPTLGAVSAARALVGPALPDGYFWAEWIVRAPTDKATISALEADNKRLREALTLSANRLHRCSVDYPTGSIQFIECGEWAAEARAELDETRRARDLSRNRRETP